MTSAPFTTRTEIEAEIARLTRQRNEWNILGWSNWDSDDELRRQIADLRDELADLTEIETATERKAA